MGTWKDAAEAAIGRVHASLPADVPLADRIKAVDDAYPFGERRYSPYKTWLAVRRDYLVKFGHHPKPSPFNKKRNAYLAAMGRPLL